MPSPVKSDASGRKYYRRTEGAYIMSPNGRLKHVGTGKGFDDEKKARAFYEAKVKARSTDHVTLKSTKGTLKTWNK